MSQLFSCLRLDSPEPSLVLETRAPWGSKGTWGVDNLRLVAGKYLVVQYRVQLKYTVPRRDRATLIYDLATGARLWQENRDGLETVALSPDGTVLAYVRDGQLEIRPFPPPLREP